MKMVFKPQSLVTRLATLAAVALFSQQAMAVGTAAGTDISNTATLDYEVGSVPQAQVSSAAVTFRVDNRVDFTLVANPDPIAPTLATVGDLGAVVEFRIVNTGNQVQDYFLSVLNSADGVTDGTYTDTGDMNNLTIVADNNDDGVLDGSDTDNFVDDLPADAPFRRVWVVADANTPIPNQLLNGDIAFVELTAVTHDGGAAGLGGLTSASGANDPLAEDVVLAVGGVLGDGDNVSLNAYELESASLTITKTRTVVEDPFNGTTNPYFIPGATVEYLLTVVNTSTTTAATSLSVSDVLDANTTLVAGAMGGNDVEVTNDATGVTGAPQLLTPCIADDATDTDGDGCAYDGGTDTLTVGNGNLAITLEANETLTLRFHVTID